MAKKDKLSANPADAARKAARQREVKKNKASREKSREFNLVKKNTSGTEAELRTLEKTGKGKSAEADGLREELKKAKEAKEKYLEAHPEHRRFIYPHSKDEAEDGANQKQQSESSTARGDTGRGLFGPDGKPRYPERSIYYDPVFNPWGNPPPGMPYVEKPPHEWASTSASQAMSQPPFAQIDSSEDEDEEDDDIIMPAGPPPTSQQAEKDDSSDDSSDEDDDIVMPSGPPPPRPPIPQSIPAGFAPPPPGGYAGPPPPFPRPPMGYAGPPPGHFSGRPPLPPQGFAGPIPRPPVPGQHRSHPYARPPLPHNGYNGRPMQGNFPPRPRPPPNAPTGPAASSSATISAPPRPASTEAAKASATISSAPQLRDLKKEAVAFLPSSVRKQKSKAVQKAKVAGLGRSVRANPEIEDEEDNEEEGTAAPDDDPVPKAQPIDHPYVQDTTSSSMQLPPAAASLPPLVPSNKEVRPPPFANSAPKSSLVGYYDSDDSDVEEEDQAGPVTTAPTQATQQGRVNLVEALRAQIPASAASGTTSKQQSKNGTAGGGQGDYEKYLQSLGDLL